MSNSVVPAAAVAHAKQLVRNKNLAKQAGNQQHAPDEQNAVDHGTANDNHQFDATNVIQVDQPDHVDAAHLSMAMPVGDVAMGDSVFTDALAGAAVSEAALTTAYAAGSAQDDGGSASDDGAGGPGSTVLLVGAVGLAGLGIAVAASGGGHNNDDGGNNGGGENQAPVIDGGDDAAVNAAANAAVFYDADATDPDGDTVTWSLSGDNADLFTINADGEVSLAEGKAVDAGSDYTFVITATDPDGATDTQNVTLSIDAITGQEISIDVTKDDANPDGPAHFDASGGAFIFVDDPNVATDVVITGFGDDDIIRFTTDDSSVYQFGNPDGDINALQITNTDNDNDVLNLILVQDVLNDDAGIIGNEARAEIALGNHFDVQDANFFQFG